MLMMMLTLQLDRTLKATHVSFHSPARPRSNVDVLRCGPTPYPYTVPGRSVSRLYLHCRHIFFSGHICGFMRSGRQSDNDNG